MIGIKEACEAFMREVPTCRIIGCDETKDYYFFKIEPRRWDGVGSGAAGGEGYCVNKYSGEVDCMPNNRIIDIYLSEGYSTKVDVLPYLSDEDVAFIKKIRAQQAY